MANFRHLHPLRVCAVMAVLMAPLVASAGPAFDTKDLRAKLKTVDAQAAQNTHSAADVNAMRVTLGFAEVPFVQPAAPVIQARPTPKISGAGGLFSLQKPQQQAASTLSVQSSTGGLFAAKPTPFSAIDHARDAPLNVGIGNFRLMLATLSQTYTGVNNLSVQTAQGARGPIALSVRSGMVTLADIQSFSAAQGHAPRPDGTLTLPVIIWPDATLRLSPGERLGLARDTGAFVMSMGKIIVEGAVIEAVGPQNPHEAGFAPFVTIAGGGALQMEDATVRGLGFGRTIKFSGLSVAGNPLMPTKQDVVIRNTLFEQVKAVTIAGAPSADISGNTFQDMSGNALNIAGSPMAQVRGNLFRGAAPTNAIRVDLGSDRAVIADNVFLKGKRVAVLVNGGSNGVIVRDNVIWKRDGGGIKFYKTQCGLAHGNLLIDNRQKGIEVRKSDGMVVRENLIAGGRSAAVWVSAQAPNAKTTVRDNVFQGNAAGLSAATGADIWIAGNNFTKQMPKLLDGDIARLSVSVVRDLKGSKPTLFSKGKSEIFADLEALCGGDI